MSKPKKKTVTLYTVGNVRKSWYQDAPVLVSVEATETAKQYKLSRDFDDDRHFGYNVVIHFGYNVVITKKDASRKGIFTTPEEALAHAEEQCCKRIQNLKEDLEEAEVALVSVQGLRK